MTDDQLSPEQDMALEAELEAAFAGGDEAMLRLITAARTRQLGAKPALRLSRRRSWVPLLWSGLAAALLLVALLPGLPMAEAGPAAAGDTASDPFADAQFSAVQAQIEDLRRPRPKSQPDLGSTRLELQRRKRDDHHIRFDLRPLTF